MATSEISIEELSGKKRRLTLKGGGLPLKGATWGGSTTLVTEFNPGNPEATQHVLSSPLKPSDWSGEWNTTRLLRAPCTFRNDQGAEQNVVYAHDLMDVFESLKEGAQLLRVTWASSQGSEPLREFKIARKGRISEFECQVSTQDDIRWSATFDWTSKGEQQKKVVEVGGADLLTKLRKAIVAADAAAKQVANDRIRASQARIKKSASTFTLGQVEQLAKGPLALADSFARAANSVSNRLKHLGDIILQVRDTPAALAGKAVDVAINGVAVANNFVDQISREGPETTSTRNKVSILTRSASYYSRTQAQAENMSAVMKELELTARAHRQRMRVQAGAAGAAIDNHVSTMQRIHTPRQGETMQSIAMRFYGEDLAAELARANGLPAYQVVPPSTPLIIPSRGRLRGDQVNSV